MMKICRFFLLLGALLGLPGCPEPPCGGSIGAPASQQPGVILVGDEARLRVSPVINDGCSTENVESPSSLTVEVSGPDNLPVSSHATLGNPPRASATVTFTPDKPGRYHVFAAFDPVGGIQQFDLYAARNRSAEAPVHALPLACGSLERTSRGGWVCDSFFVRDGGSVRQFNGARLAVAGDVVWVVSASQTQRFVDTGTALELTATLTGGTSTTETLIASETELLALRVPGVDRIVFDGTPTLVLKGSELLPTGTNTIGSTGLRYILLRSGDQVVILGNATPSSPGQPSGSFTSQACPYRIEPDRIVRLTGTCQTISGDVVGYEPGGLWVATRFAFGDGVADLRWLELAGGKLVDQASLPLGTNFEVVKRSFSLRNTAVPVIVSKVPSLDPRAKPTMPVYAPDRRTLLLEFLDSELPEPTASTSLLWSRTNNSNALLRIRVRPTAP